MWDMKARILLIYLMSSTLSGFQSHGLLQFIPSQLNPSRTLKISVDVLYAAASFTYQSCCQQFGSRPTKFLLNNTTNTSSTYAITTRRKPQITVIPREMQLPAGKKYTLLFAKEERNEILVHWMVINILDDDVLMGREALIYSSPHPEGQKSTLYVFLLYEQSKELKATDTKAYGGTDCVQAEEGRCHYRVPDFVREKGLTLVGLRSMDIYPDQYSRSLLYKLKIKTENEVCAGQKYYKGPCFTLVKGTASTLTTWVASPLFFSLTFLSLMFQMMLSLE